MSSYLLLKHLHLSLVVLSGLGFLVRGVIRLVLDRPLAHPMVRVGPHVIDTLLLASGIALWVLMSYPLWSWFGVKLALVVVYIAVGILAFRLARRSLAIVAFGVALSVFLTITGLAWHRPF